MIHHAIATQRSFRLVMFALLLTASIVLVGCPSGVNRPAVNANSPTSESNDAKHVSDFDADRAFEHVRKQVEFGPRPPGSPELEKARAYIIDQLRTYGLKVTTDEFRATTPIGDTRMVNITAELPGESSDVIIISSHYDAKYVKQFKFVGANDPGSSIGELLEVARVMAAKKEKPKLTYWFVLFDGEEAICFDWDQCHNPNPADPKTPLPDNLYGSRRYVSQLTANNELRRVRAVILFDLSGYKDLRLGRDELSTGWLLDIVWDTANQVGYGKYFVNDREGVGDDDHAPFLKAGIDSLDIIQLTTYPYWHTKEDTLDKVSAKSLKIVGDTVLVSLPKIEERVQATRR
jgi:hypothetical protein